MKRTTEWYGSGWTTWTKTPSFADDESTRLIAENSDDVLPSIAYKHARRWHGAGFGPRIHEDGPQAGKKLTYSLSLPEAYSNLFQVVPSNGNILTRR